ncbi:MAG: nitrous oxide-stimulated promoter family protein [Candidatus Thorarchaeota archaeon]
MTRSRLEKERTTIETMIGMYCKKMHSSKNGLCNECSELFNYASERLDYCQFSENKPTCEKCTIHCYKKDAKKKVRRVMRYAGPRMTYTHPIMGFRHLFKKMKKIERSNLSD